MAAATLSGLEGPRLEEKKREYFSSINSMARKIMAEREKIRARHGPAWEGMTQQQQDAAIDDWMMEPHIRARYAMHRVEREEVVCYPRLLLTTGQKLVHFGEEDITWQDEHSAPFSWETKSQLDFSLSPGSSDPVLSASPFDSRTSKPSLAVQLGKSGAGAKGSVGEGRRPEEESSFWKLSAERSRLEGEQNDFLSLTPSQIKSLEKRDKPLPSYRRQESAKEPDTPEPHPPPGPRSTKQRAPKPPAPPPPPPAPVSAIPASISVSPSPAAAAATWERSQSTLPSVCNATDDVFPSTRGGSTETRDDEAPPSGDSTSTFSQFNTSSNILKSGFDFLDNW